MPPRKKTPSIPCDVCGDCYYCHQLRKLDWCFGDPPYPVDMEDGTPASTRGVLTTATAPGCYLFKPRQVH